MTFTQSPFENLDSELPASFTVKQLYWEAIYFSWLTDKRFECSAFIIFPPLIFSNIPTQGVNLPWSLICQEVSISMNLQLVTKQNKMKLL